MHMLKTFSQNIIDQKLKFMHKKIYINIKKTHIYSECENPLSDTTFFRLSTKPSLTSTLKINICNAKSSILLNKKKTNNSFTSTLHHNVNV